MGRTPWAARVPLDPLFSGSEYDSGKAGRGPAADQGVCPTNEQRQMEGRLRFGFSSGIPETCSAILAMALPRVAVIGNDIERP